MVIKVLGFFLMVKVSVVIPVYNVEKYIEECLDSVINQTLTDIEIICINDGSTDKSLDILKRYAKEDNRIIILNESNNGAGFSRKKGLNIAKGKFVSFVDSDDYLDEKCLELAYNNGINNNSDIVFFKIKSFNSIEKTERFDPRFDLSTYFDKNTDFNSFVFDYHLVKPIVFNSFTSIWSRMFKRDFLIDNDFYFPKKLSFNDIPLHVQSLLSAKKISFVNENLYNYRLINDNSITVKSHKSDKVYDIFKISEFLEDYLLSNNLLEEFKIEFIKFKLSHYTFHLNKIENDELINKFFLDVKNKFLEMNISDDILDSFEDKYKIIYTSIVDSQTYPEYSVRNKLYKYQINYEKVKFKNETLINKNKVLVKENNSLKENNKKLKKQVETEKKKNKTLLNSNSWKITKPLRKIKKIF